ncbi:MAG: HD domain-containing protein [Oscillospiraceae bacterium]|jgi:uncharacterized protein|nr:HD domain-containing protein [Oscillospiraceae bacterium]
MEEQALAYVQAYLEKYGRDTNVQEAPYRTRSAHCARVLMWVNRLLQQGGVDDPAALRLAAAFHDVGYAHADEGHAAHSERILRDYAAEQGFAPALAERAAFLVAEHSRKSEWLPNPAAPRDLILLMEADLLDEEGALGLVRDCMNATAFGATSYLDAYRRMLRFEPRRLERHPMVTPLAQQFWAEKQRLIRAMLEALAFDLGEEGN